MTHDRKPGSSLLPSSFDLEPALDGEILSPGQKLPRQAPLYPKRFSRGLDYRRQARDEYLKADSERAFGEYVVARTDRERKLQNLAQTVMGWALLKDRHELDRLEERDRYDRQLEVIADRRDARDERERRAELARKRDTLELALLAAKTDRTIAECLSDIARFEARASAAGPAARVDRLERDLLARLDDFMARIERRLGERPVASAGEDLERQPTEELRRAQATIARKRRNRRIVEGQIEEILASVGGDVEKLSERDLEALEDLKQALLEAEAQVDRGAIDELLRPKPNGHFR